MAALQQSLRRCMYLVFMNAACSAIAAKSPGMQSTPVTFTATNFVKYFNSDTNFSVSGTVSMKQGSSSFPSQIVSWDLAGIDLACTGTEQGNICGIHIHEGKSCSEDALGHFFNVDVDPWVVGPSGDGAYYSAGDSNMAKSSSPVEIITNLTASDIIGRAVVVHDSTPPGRRIACALLVAAVDGEDDVTTTTTTTTKISTGASFIATNFVKYFNSDTNFNVSGAVFMEQGTSSIPSQIVSWDLAGIDPACTGTEQGNICGIHIHEGKSCSEDALGHFFKVDVDPWVVSPSGDGAYYSAVDSNMTKLSSLLEIITNLTASDIIGRAVVVHDSTPPGRRIACALLATRSEDRTTTPRTALAGALGHQISALAVIFAAAFF